eukprot:11059028-Ditylum_brightwellii.AAC.1
MEIGVEEAMEETVVVIMVVVMETPVLSAMKRLTSCGVVTTNHAQRWLVHSVMHLNLTVAAMVVVVITALTTTAQIVTRRDATTAWEATWKTKENMTQQDTKYKITIP